MAILLVRVNDGPAFQCEHPLCENYIQTGDEMFPARLRDNCYCSSSCREKHSRILVQWRRRQVPQKAARDRAKKIERKYGISVEDFNRLFVFQKGLCAICSVPLLGARMAVDHHHGTGMVRGLLCTPCNTGIGMLGDDPDRIIQAAAYVRSPIAEEALSVHAGKEVS